MILSWCYYKSSLKLHECWPGPCWPKDLNFSQTEIYYINICVLFHQGMLFRSRLWYTLQRIWKYCQFSMRSTSWCPLIIYIIEFGSFLKNQLLYVTMSLLLWKYNLLFGLLLLSTTITKRKKLQQLKETTDS